MAKMVFVAHPMSGDIEGNRKKVIAICRRIHSDEIIPVFPSFTWRLYLGDEPKDKQLAREVNEEYFRRGAVDEIWFYGDRLTNGMEDEALFARKYGITVIGKTPETIAALTTLGFVQP
jgi:hypothetical protein